MTICVHCRQSNPADEKWCINCGEELTAVNVRESASTDVQSFLDADKKIEAIKLYRQQTGCSLVEAKEAVEAMMRGEAVAPQSAVTPRGNVEQEVIELLRDGKKIAAIKLYREQRGGSLIDAKEAVEALQQEAGISTPKGGGCMSVLLALPVIAWLTLSLLA